MAGWADLAAVGEAASGGTLDPSVVAGIGQGSQTPGDAATNAQAAAQVTRTHDQVQGLQQQTPDQQAAVWKTLSKTDQQLYISAGYKPPAPHETGVSGFLHHVFHDVNNDIVKPVQRDVLNPVLGNAPVHDTLNALAAPLRAEQHILRSAMYITRTNISNPGGDPRNSGYLQPWEAILSPHDWAQGWQKTMNGEHTFDPYYDRQIQQKYGADTASLAKAIASGDKITDLLAKYPDQGAPLDADGNTPRQAIAKRISADPQLREAVGHYQNAKYSLGRLLVGAPFMNHNPTVGKLLSGSIDGLYDWFADPTVKGMQSVKAFNDARYLVRTPEEADRLYHGSTAVRGLYGQLADAVATKNTAAILDRFPKLAPLAPDLIKAGADTPQAVNEWVKGWVGMKSMLEGVAARSGEEPSGIILPHLTAGGRLVDAVTAPIQGLADRTTGVPVLGKTLQFVAHPVNFLADTPERMQGREAMEPVRTAQVPGSTAHPVLNAALHPVATLETGLGRVARSFLNLDPTVGGKAFDASSPDALNTIRSYASGFLPKARVDEIVNLYAQAGDLGLRYKLWRGIVDEVGQAAGVGLTPETADWWRQTLGKLDDHIPGKQYSFPGNDQWLEGDQQLTAGLLKGHMQDQWAMPSFRELYAQTRKLSVTRSVMGTINNAAVDHLMQSVWKPLTLMHMGFTIRTATDELLGAVLREGPLGIAKARLAASSLNTGADLLPYHPLSRIWDAFTAHLPQEAVDRINTPSDLIAEHFGDKVNRAMRGVAGKLAGPEYVSAARAAYEGGYLDGTVPEIISAIHGRAAGYMDDAPTVQKLMVDGQVKKVQLKTVDSGSFRGYVPGEQLYHHMWASNLDEIAKDDWARTSLQHLADDPQARTAAVADQLQADPQWRKSVRSTGTSDGRRVVTNEVTEREAALDHANRINQHVDSLIRSRGSSTTVHVPVADAEGRAIQEVTGEPYANIPEGHVRLFRGEVPGGERGAQPHGENWTLRHSFAQTFAKDGKVYYVDIPQEGADAMRGEFDRGAEFAAAQRAGDEKAIPTTYFESAGTTRGPKQIPAQGGLLTVGDRTLAQYLLDERKTPTVAALAEHPEENLPIGVRGPDVIPIPTNKFQSLVSKGFDNLVGRPMNWMVRQPLWLHNFAEARQAVGGLAGQLAEQYGSNANLDKLLTDIAAERATATTLPYIHDPSVRSQFAVLTRNLSPFWFAQEQAFKRWARTFTYAPDAMRKLQLLNGGLQHSGIIHTDAESGQKYFLLPGTNFADKTLNALAERVTGNKFSLPIPTNMQGSVQWLSPIRDGVLPSFSPVVAMPLTALVNHFPELQPVKQSVLQHAGNAQYLKEVVPSTLYSVLDAIAPDMINHAQYNSAWMQTLQSFEATGHGLGPDATPEQIQTVLDRTKNYTRTRIILRSLLGFGTPSAPQFALDNLHGDLQQLMTELPPNEAISVFQQMHPDATPYTVFQSKSVSGAPLPATAEAMNWMNDNMALIKRYPYAAAYLLPQNPGKYDPTAYQEQLATGLRIRKTPQQFLDDILYSQAAGDYFKQDQQKNQLLASIHSSFQRSKVTNAWSQWSQQYMAQNPVFAKILQGGADGTPPATWTRTQIQSELSNALNTDPGLSGNPAYASLRTLVNNYDHYQALIAQYSGQGNSYFATVRKQLGERFAYDTLQYVHNNPETEPYFNRVIRPAMTASITALGVAA